MASLSDMRYGHTSGRCGLIYTPEGNHIITCGSDGEIRLFRGIDDDDAPSTMTGNYAIAVACNGSKIFVAPSDTNRVDVYTYPECKENVPLTRFTADASCLDCSGSLVAAGSSDMTIKVVDAESFKATEFKGHAAPVLCAIIDPAPEKEFLLSTSCDGSVVVWLLATAAAVKKWECVLPQSNDASNSPSPSKAAWHPRGAGVAVPMNQTIKVFARNTWDEEAVLKPKTDLGTDELFSCVAYSPDGAHIVGATTKGNMIVWKLRGGEVAFEGRTSRGYEICSIAWHPSKREIAFADAEGFWGVMENAPSASASAAPKQPAVTIVQDDEDMDEDALASALFEDDDDDDNENSFSIRKIKKETGFASHDEDSNLSGLEKEGSAAAGADGESGSAAVVAPPAAVVRIREPEQQEPFQPGSTPVRFSARFMKWNSTGIVRCFNNEDDNSIEVEFHDSSIHHPIHISNNHGYTMADLSSDTLVLACEANEDEMTPSRLVCHNLVASDRSKEWSVDMPGKEEILAVCCGQGWLAAATDTRNLRLFTASGLQRGVLKLPGRVVALAGHGDHLLVSVHAGAPVGEGQTLAFAVLSAVSKKHPTPHFRPLPLAPNSALSWLGFSDEGTPCLMDTAGQVSMLSSSYGSMWAQVADTRATTKSKSDHYFIVGASTVDRKLRCIFCKGSRYPQLLPVPSVVMVSMTLPLCEPATEKSMLEEQLLWSELLPVCDGTPESVEDVEREQNEILVRLFALACKSEHDSRALDICKLMDTATIQIAIKYASKMRKMQLATRLSELACAIQEREEEAMERCESNADLFETENRDYESDDSELIEPTQANPILMAKMKKEAQKSTRVNKEIVNPFKKSTSNGQSGCAVRSGLVFDDMKQTQPTSSNRSKSQFGSRALDKPEIRPSPLQGRQGLLVLKKKGAKTGKENLAESLEPLKGFQLWLAENKDSLGMDTQDEEDLKAKGLEKWNSLSKDERDRYSLARVPKRKRDQADNDEFSSSSKALKT